MFTRCELLDDIVTRGYFYVHKSFGPGWSAHQPQESGHESNNEVLEQKKYELIMNS